MALRGLAGLVRERPDFTCFGGGSPYLDGNKAQFVTLETNPGSHKARSLLTFAVNSKDFFRAIGVNVSDIRVLEKNADARAIGCTAKLTAKIEWSIFDQALLSRELIKFGNFDGHVTGWSTQFEVRSTVRQELENTYSSLLSVRHVEYVAQYGTDGRLFVELDLLHACNLPPSVTGLTIASNSAMDVLRGDDSDPQGLSPLLVHSLQPSPDRHRTPSRREVTSWDNVP